MNDTMTAERTKKRANPVPPLESLRALLALDSQSPSGLRYVQTGRVAGHLSGGGYYAVTIGRKHYRAHRLVWAIANGMPTPTDMEVDHINGIRGDNRPENLRLCTSAENHQNLVYGHRKLQGATYDTHGNRWVAVIQVNGKKRTIGRFDTDWEAHEAYLAAKKELHGYCPTYRVDTLAERPHKPPGHRVGRVRHHMAILLNRCIPTVGQSAVIWPSDRIVAAPGRHCSEISEAIERWSAVAVSAEDKETVVQRVSGWESMTYCLEVGEVYLTARGVVQTENLASTATTQEKT